MRLELTTDEAEALHDLLATRLGDYSAEIAATDNPSFRRELRERRDLLHGIQGRLDGELTPR